MSPWLHPCLQEIKTTSHEKQAWELPPQKEAIISSLKPCGPCQLQNVTETGLEKGPPLNYFKPSSTSETRANLNT